MPDTVLCCRDTTENKINRVPVLRELLGYWISEVFTNLLSHRFVVYFFGVCVFVFFACFFLSCWNPWLRSKTSYSWHYLELSGTRTLWKRMCWKSVLKRFPSWRHSSEHFPWGQMAPSLTEFNGERRQLPYLWSKDNYHNPKGHKFALKVNSIHLTKINNHAFHPPKECTGLVWPFHAAFHSRTPVKMFSRADQRFLLLSPGWYNLTAAWHQGQLETGNSYVSVL